MRGLAFARAERLLSFKFFESSPFLFFVILVIITFCLLFVLFSGLSWFELQTHCHVNLNRIKHNFSFVSLRPRQRYLSTNIRPKRRNVFIAKISMKKFTLHESLWIILMNLPHGLGSTTFLHPTRVHLQLLLLKAHIKSNLFGFDIYG